jgi:membrane-associated phospholipid phosphatase
VDTSAELPFSLDFLQFLYEHRSIPLTYFFQLATFLGEVEGYVLVVILIYVAFDKGLAFKLSALVLATMCLNHIMKILIKNPRPFITSGTYLQQWAVTAEKAADLATEYSTPSGHAMSAAAFYTWLRASITSQPIRWLAVLAILLTGLSRPYVGVHYLEDVIVGWILGLLWVVLLMLNAERISALWHRYSHPRQIMIVTAVSILLWLLTIAVNGWSIDAQPRAFMGYAGFLTGIVIAYPLEVRMVGFDPRSASLICKALRYLLTVALVLLTLLMLDELFERLGEDASILGHLLQYIRYILAGTAGMLLAPMLFTRLGLAGRVGEGSMQNAPVLP